MADQNGATTCQALTRKELRCQNHPMKGSRYCYVHSLGHVGGVPLLKNATFHAFLGIVGIAVSTWFGLSTSHQENRKTQIVLETASEIKSIREMLESVEKQASKELLKKYPGGYVLFAIDRMASKTEFVVPRNSTILREYEFDWRRVRVSELTETLVTIEMPNIHYKPLNTQLLLTAFGVPRRPLGKQHRFPLKPKGSTYRIFIELLEDNNSEFLFAIGFKEE